MQWQLIVKKLGMFQTGSFMQVEVADWPGLTVQ